MADKISIINDCLLLKGYEPVATEDDGSQEWNVASAAYEHGVKHLLQEHDWKFGTAYAILTRSGASDSSAYDDAYARPVGALQIISLTVDGVAGPDYRIVGNKIHINADQNYEVVAKYVAQPDATELPPMFISALNEWIYWGIEGGLKKDAIAAMKHQSMAESYLAKARTRVDQQEPKRALFIGTTNKQRRTRRG